MQITIKDVARMAKVSVATASMAINGKDGVNEKTRLKVLDAAQKLDYHPNHFAKSLIANRSLAIGLIVTDITNPYFGAIVKNIQKEVENIGYDLLLGISNDKLENEKKSTEYFLSRNVEGLIIVPAHVHEKEIELSHLYNLKRLGIPFVFITTYYKGIPGDFVMTDLEKGSYELTKYLIKNGNKKIYFISGYKELLLSSLRIKGYKKAYEEFNLAYSDEWIIESYPDFINGYNVTKKIIEKDIPEAIITVNDLLAIGALKCLKDNGIKVPDEVSVAGYDDLLFAAIAETPLTTVRQPIEDICKNSVRILMERINQQNSLENRMFLEPELVIRKSTR